MMEVSLLPPRLTAAQVVTDYAQFPDDDIPYIPAHSPCEAVAVVEAMRTVARERGWSVIVWSDGTCGFLMPEFGQRSLVANYHTARERREMALRKMIGPLGQLEGEDDGPDTQG